MRTPMVTRTITTTNVTVLCADAIEQEMYELNVTLPRTYKDDKALMKAVSQAVDVDEADKKIKAVSVIKTEVVETLYGMSELEFIKAAKVLPPRAQAND